MRLKLTQTDDRWQETQIEKHEAELWTPETILQSEEIQVAIKRSWRKPEMHKWLLDLWTVPEGWQCGRKTDTLHSCRDYASNWEVDRSTKGSNLLNWRDTKNSWSPQKSCFVMEKRERKSSKYTKKSMLFHIQHSNFIHNSIMFIIM